jgi:RNase P/RNase MRP subunit p29
VSPGYLASHWLRRLRLLMLIGVDVGVGATSVAATVGIRGAVVGGTVRIEKEATATHEDEAVPLGFCA